MGEEQTTPRTEQEINKALEDLLDIRSQKIRYGSKAGTTKTDALPNAIVHNRNLSRAIAKAKAAVRKLKNLPKANEREETLAAANQAVTHAWHVFHLVEKSWIERNLKRLEKQLDQLLKNDAVIILFNLDSQLSFLHMLALMQTRKVRSALKINNYRIAIVAVLKLEKAVGAAIEHFNSLSNNGQRQLRIKFGRSGKYFYLTTKPNGGSHPSIANFMEMQRTDLPYAITASKNALGIWEASGLPILTTSELKRICKTKEPKKKKKLRTRLSRKGVNRVKSKARSMLYKEANGLDQKAQVLRTE